MNRMLTMLLILLVLPMFASAEIYKYRDANGVLRFTDNLAEVPVAQRKNIQQYQEIKTTSAVVEPAGDDTDGEGTAKDAKNLEKELTDEKGVLDNEYSQLMQMRNRLESDPQPSTPEEIAAHENKVQDYNIQLKIYEVKQKAFREKVQAYQDALSDKQ
jgi:Domain of unknown function (DUF4124)